MADIEMRVSILLALLSCVTPGSTYVSFCYFSSQSTTRSNPDARISIDDIDPGLCTHLLYAFAKIDQNTISVVAPYQAQAYGQGGHYAQFNQLKQRNPSLKTLLAVGSAGGYIQFVPLFNSTDSIAQFSRNTASYLRRYGFDGLEVDWEFPDDTTKSQYSALLKGLREEFDKPSGDGKPLILTAAVSSREWIVKRGYNIAEISRYLDYILIMTYNFPGPRRDATSFDSPLMARDDLGFTDTNNVDYAVQLWKKGVSDSGKLLLGMKGAWPHLILANSSNHGVGAPVSGRGPGGDIYMQKQYLIYTEICKNLKKGWTRKWDEKQHVPYAYSGNNWVGYDDTQSIKEKALYAMEHQLGGVTFWELSLDDPKNICQQGKFPLLNVVKETLNIPSDQVTTTEESNSASESFVNSSLLLLCSCELLVSLMMSILL